MRTRELLGRLHRQLSLTRSGKDKQFLIDLCARIEQAELDLRRYRLTGKDLYRARSPAPKGPAWRLCSARERKETPKKGFLALPGCRTCERPATRGSVEICGCARSAQTSYGVVES